MVQQIIIGIILLIALVCTIFNLVKAIKKPVSNKCDYDEKNRHFH